MIAPLPLSVWPAGRAPAGPARGPGLLADPDRPGETIRPPGSFPVPAGRGLWRLGLHRRQWAAVPWQSTLLTELVDVRGRRLEQQLNGPAKFTFSVDGRHPTAKLIRELATDVYAWRWDDQVGRDRLMFRGIVAQAEDEVTENTHTVVFTCHDYLAMLGRRFLTFPTETDLFNQDQDNLVNAIVDYAAGGFIRPSDQLDPDGDWRPGAFLPIVVARRNPDGTLRIPLSGRMRDRVYTGNQKIDEIVDDLSKVIDGFDYDCWPNDGAGNVTDLLRVFYPVQGERRDIPLQYGSTVAGFTRSVNSGDYSNYWRVLGDPGDMSIEQQLYGEAWDGDTIRDTPNLGYGLWMGGENAADVSVAATLRQKAAGDLAVSGQIVAHWTLRLRPGAYSYGNPNMGDTVPLMVRAGRIDEAVEIRVIGIAYAVGDDGQEDIELTVGRPSTTAGEYLTQSDRDVDALVRRDLGGLSPPLPRGVIAEAVTPNGTQTVPGGSGLQILLPLTFPVYAGRRYRITAYLQGTQTNADGTDARLIVRDPGPPIREGVINASTGPVMTNGRWLAGTGIAFLTATANGNRTAQLAALLTGGGQLLFITSGPDAPAGRLTVEDIGGS